jgi:hypothetical protein
LKKTFQKITVAFWLLTLTVSTMGFNMHLLYCYCTGESEVGFFEIEHHCTAAHGDETGLATHPKFKNLPACCKKALTCHNPEKGKKDKHDCTKKTRKYLKADLKYLEVKKTELPKLELLAILYTPNKPNYTAQTPLILNYKFSIPRKPPPQYYGRKLLNFIQVYRC